MSGSLPQIALTPEHPNTRRYPRHKLDRPIRAAICGCEPFSNIPGRCRELGEGGLGAFMSDQLYPGEIVSIELSPTLKVYAAVRFLRGFYHGFEFVFVRERDREKIKHFCSQFKPGQNLA
jgi:hypothetical protein